MDADSYLKLKALNRCVFQPGSWVKRFVHDLAVLGPYDLLTPAQQQSVDSVYWHYRRQVNVMRNNGLNAPIPTEPDDDVVLRVRHRDELVKEIGKVDRKTADAMLKMEAWNRKAKGKS